MYLDLNSAVLYNLFSSESSSVIYGFLDLNPAAIEYIFVSESSNIS